VKSLTKQLGATAAAFLKCDCGISSAPARACALTLTSHTQMPATGWALMSRQNHFKVVFSCLFLKFPYTANDRPDFADQWVLSEIILNAGINNDLLCYFRFHPLHLPYPTLCLLEPDDAHW